MADEFMEEGKGGTVRTPCEQGETSHRREPTPTPGTRARPACRGAVLCSDAKAHRVQTPAKLRHPALCQSVRHLTRSATSRVHSLQVVLRGQPV